MFSAHPEVLQVEGLDIVNVAGFTAKHPASAKHQLLVYMSLLETTKPYLTASMRMPSLPTLLLFSHSLDTNTAMDRVVCDSWLELRFARSEDGGLQLLAAARLRDRWQRLLDLKLSTDEGDENSAVLEKKLQAGLLDLVHNDTAYSVRRLLPADIKELYVGPQHGSPDLQDNPFGEFQPEFHAKKGGTRLTRNITHGCLAEEAGLQTELRTCPACQQELYCSALSALSHYSACTQQEEQEQEKEEESNTKTTNSDQNSLARDWTCRVCDQNFNFTTGQIMKHKKQCSV